MVDSVISAENSVTITSFLIKDENVFLEDGLFREPGMIENIAQSAAAGIGARSAGTFQNPKLGFIGAIRDLKIFSFPRTGDTIITKVTVTHEILNATVASGEIRLDGKLFAECELRIFTEDR